MKVFCALFCIYLFFVAVAYCDLSARLTEGRQLSTSNSAYEQSFVDALPEPPECGGRFMEYEYDNLEYTELSDCGENTETNFFLYVDEFIRCGYNARLGEMPWIAVFGNEEPDASIPWRCGGTLITSKHVLTSAHCAQRDNLSFVRLGALNINNEADGAHPINVNVDHVMVHEGYENGKIADDIAILVLSTEVEFTDLIKPICLPISPDLRNQSFEGRIATICGWGKTDWNESKADHLQIATVPVLSKETCDEMIPNSGDFIICAGGLKKDSCAGDSGGPLMVPVKVDALSELKYYYEIGIISSGLREYPCGEEGVPGDYMRVTYYLPWICSKVLGHTCV